MIWREKRVWLIVLALALVADVFVFVTYRVQFQSRIQDVETRREQAEQRLAQAKQARAAAQDSLARYRKIQADLGELYNTTWATQEQRFTPWVTEVKSLSEASQLVPKVISFNKVIEDKAAGAASASSSAASRSKAIGTSTVTMQYTVLGTYQQVRRLINLLELSPQFVIIDALSVTSGNTGDLLTVNLRLKTIFRQSPAGTASSIPPAAGAPAKQQVAASGHEEM